jgi:hypothetical protein
MLSSSLQQSQLDVPLGRDLCHQSLEDQPRDVLGVPIHFRQQFNFIQQLVQCSPRARATVTLEDQRIATQPIHRHLPLKFEVLALALQRTVDGQMVGHSMATQFCHTQMINIITLYLIQKLSKTVWVQ